MSQTGVVARLALRELWISFRMLILLAAYVAAGAVVALLPAAPPTVLARLAVGVAAAMVAGAAIAGWSISRDRSLGRTAWLATHSIPRGTILVGWFAALTLVSTVGLGAVGALGWLAAAAPVPALDPLAFGATVAAIGCSAVALLAGGLLLGTLLPPWAAALVAAGGGGILLGGLWLAVPSVATPLEALVQLPRLDNPVSAAVQAAGVGLAATAVLLFLARLAIERVDL